MSGFLQKKSGGTQMTASTRWQLRWCRIAANILFYHAKENDAKPLGFVLLEECEAVALKPEATSNDLTTTGKFVFSVGAKRQRQFEFFAETEEQRRKWLDAIENARFQVQVAQKNTLLHQLEEEKKRVAQLERECDRLRAANSQLRSAKNTKIPKTTVSPILIDGQEIDEEAVIRVQTLVRVWTAARKWKKLVNVYVKSDHASVLRKRNMTIRELVKDEETYVGQLDMLVNLFEKSFTMAASSSKPIISPQEVTEIFRNSSTLLFAHQLFLSKLNEKMGEWPSVLLGDVFAMLVPILSIYNDYVRNLQHAMKVLAQCKKSRNTTGWTVFAQKGEEGQNGSGQSTFVRLLSRCEMKAQISLETLLISPMLQVPRYVQQITEIVKCTPHDHIEAEKLSAACKRLQILSDDILERRSDAEDRRVVLEIEKNFAEGCVEILDSVFVRQSQFLFRDKGKEQKRQVFLFTTVLVVAQQTPTKKWKQTGEGCCVLYLKDGIFLSTENENLEIIFKSKKDVTFNLILAAQSSEEKMSFVSDLRQTLAAHGVVDATAEKPKEQEFVDTAEIKFTKSENEGVRVRAATVNNLLRLLTDPEKTQVADVEFLNTFLLAYRTYTTSEVVLNHLIEQYNSNNVSSADTQTSDRWLNPEEGAVSAVRLRVFNVLRHWLTKHNYDFEEITLRTSATTFLEKIQMSDSPAEKKMATTLLKLFSAKDSSLTVVVDMVLHPERESYRLLMTSMSDVTLDASPRVMAEQLTLIDSEVFRSIHAKEFIGQAWAKKNKYERAPRIMAMIERFNAVSTWVSTSVITAAHKKRTNVLAQWIETAEQCLSLNNYNGVMQILAGLGASAVYRLRMTWEELPPKTQKSFEDMRELMSQKGNFSALRDRLRQSDTPCVPYLGVYLTDLTFCDDGNPDYLEENGVSLVNVTKMRLISQTLRDIKQYQHTPYSLHPDQQIVAFWLAVQPMSDDDLYAASLRIQPRGAQPSGSARLAPASGESGGTTRQRGLSSAGSMRISPSFQV
eukprot:TRINITY_DN1045_c0_g1_i6.p1 TRINITY_DN1045_c0_g1~~TRINITY_DN1045_c0_g1_i6.p1  ORF type:complete len:1041 (+),score=256.98 TRINITY_DN1045_c0_g1_i6:81-3125(+)